MYGTHFFKTCHRPILPVDMVSRYGVLPFSGRCSAHLYMMWSFILPEWGRRKYTSLIVRYVFFIHAPGGLLFSLTNS